MKYLKIALLLSSIHFLCNPSIASEVNYKDYNNLQRYFSSEVKTLMRQYNNTNSLQSELFDSSDDTIKSFLESSANSNSQDLLAMQYFPDFKVRNQKTSFCFIFYDAKKNIFEQYKANKKMTHDEIFQYLTWHEMGHCFAYHEKFIKSERENEFIADAFAISIAINNEKNTLPTKIIKHIGSLPESDIHANKNHLEKFLFAVLDKNLFSQKLSINQIMEIVYYYHEKNHLNGFEFKK